MSSFTGLEVTDKLSIGNPSTRTGEDGYTTVFKPGDAIGVFALRDFETPNIATIDNVYNLKLVYSETDGVVHGFLNLAIHMCCTAMMKPRLRGLLSLSRRYHHQAG